VEGASGLGRLLAASRFCAAAAVIVPGNDVRTFGSDPMAAVRVR